MKQMNKWEMRTEWEMYKWMNLKREWMDGYGYLDIYVKYRKTHISLWMDE